ncbi:MAG: UvrD-helicase domain-containing protein [Gammaproteobacteria bacterium]
MARILELGLTRLRDEVVQRFAALLEPGETKLLERLTDHAAARLGNRAESTGDRYRLVAEMLTTTKGEFRKQITRRQGFSPEDKALKGSLLELIERFQRRHMEQQVANLRFLPPASLSDQAVQRLVNVCINLALANAELSDVFRQAGVNDFTTLILNAQSALGGSLAPTDLTLALDYRIRHILVDEFQDTSVSQFRLFETLLDGWTDGDGSTFFAVGDPMQSIYRFRDADVGLFFEAWERGIGNVTLEPAVLSSNFRADPGLVRWTNHTYGRIMGSRQDPVVGRIGYRPAAATRDSTAIDPAVSLSLHGDPVGQIEAVVDRIESLLTDTDDRIAVLVRSRAHLKGLLAALRHRGIGWHANDVDPLLDKPVVRDLLNLIGALEDPWDRLTWFCVLRSPLVGLTLRDLQILAPVAQFPDGLDAVGPELSPSGLARVERLVRAWALCAGKVDETPPRSVVETLWLRLGGADAYDDPTALVHATRLLELVDELGTQGLSAGAVRQAAAGLYAADISDSRLEIMTIHKAKGLEFDHVLLPFLDRTTSRDEAELLLWRALPQGLVMGVRDDAGAYEWLMRENRYRERHEWQRLLYVACTRARRTLALFAVASADRRASESSLLSLLLPAIEDAPDMTVSRVAEPAPPIQADLFEAIAPVPGLVRLVDDHAFLPPSHPSPQRAASPVAARGLDLLGRRKEVVLGIVVHAALERLAGGPLPNDAAAWVTLQQPVWRREAARHDLDAGDVDAVVDECARQLLGVLNDPDGRWLLQPHEAARSEFPVTGVIEGRAQNLILDRTFRSDGERWLIDYKTAVPERGLDQQRFVDSELARYRSQLTRYAAVAEALFDEPPRVAIYFTALPRLVHL